MNNNNTITITIIDSDSMSMYELTTQRIQHIIDNAGAVPIAPIVPPVVPIVASPTPIAMVRRVSTSYQQDQLQTSIYSKYGDGDGDGDNECVDARVFEPVHHNHHNSASTNVVVSGGGGGGATAHKPGPRFFPSFAKNTNSSNNQLLWCFYIAQVGMFAYETMTNAFVVENAFKYATVDHVRANASRVKSQFKRHKLSIPSFEAELISTKILSLHMMTGLALCYERNILYVDNRKYFEIIATDETDPFTIIEKVKNRYCVHIHCDGGIAGEKMRHMCRSEFWKMESITSPLKSVSQYKLAELQDIYARLNIKQTLPPTTHPHLSHKKMTKDDLHGAIVMNM